jgi:bifunctional DNA-binding transcriptional regulator/antitoxin component of YhaV-PrlF toxin-antitoxin module
MRFTVKVRELNRVTIPYEIVEAYNINKTDIVELELIKVKKV